MDRFHPKKTSLAEINTQVAAMLSRGAADARDPLHTLCLLTRGSAYPGGRMVVFRKWHANPPGIEAHTDVLSSKWGELMTDPRCAWVGWHPRQRVQLRVEGLAQLHTKDELASDRWARIPPLSRSNYRSGPVPGASLAHPWSGKDTEPDFERFGVILCTVQRIDWLWLGRENHLRAQIEWRQEAWHSYWTAP